VSGVRCQASKKADRLGSYKAGKLEGLNARKLPGFLASQPSSYELWAISYELFCLTTIVITTFATFSWDMILADGSYRA
jgi:hypothetical protein